MDMKHWQWVKQHISGTKAPDSMQGQSIAREVAVGQHGPFGLARSARGVENRCNIVLANRLDYVERVGDRRELGE